MANIIISERKKLSFLRIAELSGQELDIISNVLDDFPIGYGRKTLTDALLSKGDLKDAAVISDIIFEISQALYILNLPKDEVVSQLRDSALKLYSDLFDSEKAENLALNISKIVDHGKNLLYTNKAGVIINNNERLFQETKIITDIRPIFNDSLDDKNRFAGIIHNLNISFSNNGDTNKFYITMDNQDLNRLKEEIERAIEKEKHIQISYSEIFSFVELKD